ncbi:MAG: ribonuclease P protein subunit [Candidatus Altiarchaeales archaeon]|nr:ribonuclease P protein subunit [Candidatus Altiarchaeales archaeon]
MITPYNVLRHELIGLQAKIAQAKHKPYEKIVGTITGESRNTITIKQKGVEKKIPKESITLELTFDEKTRVSVDGKLLLARPEDRIKKKIKIKFS